MSSYENWLDLAPFVEKEPALLNAEQMAKFTAESIDAREVVMDCDPYEWLDQLEQCVGQSVVTVDLGGNKVSAVITTLSDELELVPQGNPSILKSKNGVAYFEFLEEIAYIARLHGLPVGFSCAGTTQGTELLDSTNAGIFVEKLHEKHGGDVQKLVPTLRSFENDAVAGLASAAMEAAKQDPQTRNVIYEITGGGSGLAILTWDEVSRTYKMYATEAGHVELIDALNPGQTTPCGRFGNEKVCVERAAASGAGIEDLYFIKTGKKWSGIEIEELYNWGDPLAAQLYEGSAVLTAHIIKGAADALGLTINDPSTVVVGHGGGFKFKGYGLRIDQILSRDLTEQIRFMQTHDYTPNACADGAGKLALINTLK